MLIILYIIYISILSNHQAKTLLRKTNETTHMWWPFSFGHQSIKCTKSKSTPSLISQWNPNSPWHWQRVTARQDSTLITKALWANKINQYYVFYTSGILIHTKWERKEWNGVKKTKPKQNNFSNILQWLCRDVWVNHWQIQVSAPLRLGFFESQSYRDIQIGSEALTLAGFLGVLCSCWLHRELSKHKISLERNGSWNLGQKEQDDFTLLLLGLLFSRTMLRSPVWSSLSDTICTGFLIRTGVDGVRCSYSSNWW